MKISVCARVTYNYEVEVPDEVDVESAADSADPVFPYFVMLLMNKGLKYDGEIVSIVDEDTEEVLYVAD